MPADGARIVDDERYHVLVSADGEWIGVCRLRFEPEDAPVVLAEVQRLSPGAHTGWQTPRQDLAEALLAAGARLPEPPLDPTFTALATDREPPLVEGVDVRRVASFEDHVAGLEIMLASVDWSEEQAARRRAEAPQRYERRQQRPGGEWLASIDGRVVAWAAASGGPRGLYLDGGATVPEARGRGCYRALIRARWQHAVERGTPGLTVGAQDSSRPILERCGFEVVCTMYEVETDP